MRDIDLIVEKVKEQLPEIKVSQLQKIHPADDDGIWWFSLPGLEKNIQIESSFGNCPFIIETNELCCENARQSGSKLPVVSGAQCVNALEKAGFVVHRPTR